MRWTFILPSALLLTLGSVSASLAGGDAQTCKTMYDYMSMTYRYCPERGAPRDANKFYDECMKTDYKKNKIILNQWVKEAKACMDKADARAASCEHFAKRMDTMQAEAHRLDCAFTKGPRDQVYWNNSHDYWVKQCVNGGEKQSNAKYNESALQRNLDKCKAGSNTGDGDTGGQTMTVKAEVTVYNTYKDGNKDLCYLRPGDKVTKLSADGATGKWLHVKGTSGICNGKTGYVYNNGELT